MHAYIHTYFFTRRKGDLAMRTRQRIAGADMTHAGYQHPVAQTQLWSAGVPICLTV